MGELAAGVEQRLTGPGALNAAFLVSLCGPEHPGFAEATRLLGARYDGPQARLAEFYTDALQRVGRELVAALGDPDLSAAVADAVGQLEDPEALWRAFFPEGVGILGHEEARVAELRERRTIRLEGLNPRPIADPSSELLFTANVLLTVPAEGTDVAELSFDEALQRAVEQAVDEEQLHWYDHPIQIGVEPAANELLYGLRALDAAIAFERRRDPALGRLKVVLSTSVTHEGLRPLARDYVRHELVGGGRLENLQVYLFTEDDVDALVAEVLGPLVDEVDGDVDALIDVFGVDGEYGRHYTFLKAIAALWQVVVDPALRATFKFDLDQVFPQDELVAQTGASALEHLRSPLWGAHGRDEWGHQVELGMIAGALVNERDIGSGVFTPDVPLPAGPAKPDERVFFSRLPQALSTRAEMMERYDGPERDGEHACLERIHVTGGTNGILIDALRRHRPFTPTFIGRAEDQAYILSVLDQRALESGRPRLAYAHRAGLFMRHDKESFAGGAIEAARVGKLVGDDVRILYFTAYANLLGRERLKSLIDPFTGCFVSRLPVTVVMLRLALRIDDAFARGDDGLANDLLDNAPRRLLQALDFTADAERLAAVVERERGAWQSYYDALDRLEEGLASGDGRTVELGQRALGIIGRTLLE
jgi:hypothetical protein